MCDSDCHSVLAYSKKPGHLLYLLLAAHPYMVLCPQRVSYTNIKQVKYLIKKD